MCRIILAMAATYNLGFAVWLGVWRVGQGRVGTAERRGDARQTTANRCAVEGIGTTIVDGAL